MKQSDYPAQEPLSPAGEAYGAECWRRGVGIEGLETAYGEDPYQRLIVYPASKPDGRVLLFWHGGGWTSGYKEWMAFMAPAFNAAGIVFVSAGYRLAPTHVFPDALDDCAAAMRWVEAHINEHGGDPGNLFIGGHSAGGHYASLLSVSERLSRARGLDPARVRGCLPLSGVFNFGPGAGLAVRPRFLGADPANDIEASPIRQIERTPPFLVACGSNDFPHLVIQAGEFAAAMGTAGGFVEHLVMADRTHFTASFAGGEVEGPWLPRALAFMERFAAA